MWLAAGSALHAGEKWPSLGPNWTVYRRGPIRKRKLGHAALWARAGRPPAPPTHIALPRSAATAPPPSLYRLDPATTATPIVAAAPPPPAHPLLPVGQNWPPRAPAPPRRTAPTPHRAPPPAHPPTHLLVRRDVLVGVLGPLGARALHAVPRLVRHGAAAAGRGRHEGAQVLRSARCRLGRLGKPGAERAQRASRQCRGEGGPAPPGPPSRQPPALAHSQRCCCCRRTAAHPAPA